MSLLSSLLSNRRDLHRSINNLLGFWPKNIALYELAFRHRSVAKEIREGVKDSNERLEFLGDAVLGAIVANYLFSKFPFKDEGFLTELRSKIVSRAYLNKLALKIGLDKLIQYDDSNKLYKSICGDTFEALIGAIYLDKGFDFTEKLILNRIIRFHVDIDELEKLEVNFKSKIINWAQRNRKSISFDAREENPPDKQRLYYVTVFVDDEAAGEGVGFSKKSAEQAASENACNLLLEDSSVS
ncbi:MAG: ribonuclease III [Bacteroidia bacterium]